MIAKISHGANLYGVISYNQRKVEQEKAVLLLSNKLPTSYNLSHFTPLMLRFFEPYLVVNIKTEKPVLHISLNPDPKDHVSDDRFREMAQRYMEEMGYGNQPFLVYKHQDIERTHIHIVSICIDENGRKIKDTFEKRRSMETCRKLENEFQLAPITSKKRGDAELFNFTPVDYRKNDVKGQMASVIRYLPKYYSFSTLGEYNALLSLFNITYEKVEAQIKGTTKTGLLYFALNEKGNKVSNPLKASLFGKIAGLPELSLRMNGVKTKSDERTILRSQIRGLVQDAILPARSEKDFKTLLLQKGINIVIRKNDAGRIYGITFIDHNSHSVWNGSRLSKDLSARVFDEWWSNGKRPVVTKDQHSGKEAGLLSESGNKPLDFIKTSDTFIPMESGEDLLEYVGALIPHAQGDDSEELNFEYQMKKKRKRKKKI
ncbi:conjugal transfer protein MobB [Elizabethkingia ursingii]